MELSQATWTEVDEHDAEAALLPVGSTEQHGPHAPLGTDAIAAELIATDTAEATDRAVVVAPTIDLGVSEEHRAFDGTMWVRPETFRAMIRDAVESLANHGIDRVVVVNGHGGNVEALAEVCRTLTRSGDAYAVPFTWFDAIETEVAMGHAGALETALLRHARPELLREERVETAAAGAADRWGEWVSGANLAVDVDEFSDNGVVGDPSAGDAALGAELLERSTEALDALLEAVIERERRHDDQ
jgi:creatinine amidohydrolase